MDFHTWLMQLGLPTYRDTIFTSIPSGQEQQFDIAKQIPTNIGRIFGVSVDVNNIAVTRVAKDNKPLPTVLELSNLYITLKDGSTEFLSNWNLLDLVYTNPNGSNAVLSGNDGARYHPVNIPGNFDLSTSFYQNPTLIVSAASPALPKSIQLNLWYISIETYKYLLESKMVRINGHIIEPAEINNKIGRKR